MKPKLISGVLFVFFILVACTPATISAPAKTATPPQTSTPVPTQRSIATVISLKDKWRTLESRAVIWHSDAYLSSVLIFVGSKDPHQDQLVADYLSPSDAFGRTFGVAITAQGEIIDLWSEDVIMISDHKTPISLQDLKIDSQEALDIFARDESVAMCLQPKADSIGSLAMLTLYYNDQILTWRLEGCANAGNSKPYHYLNAYTGELIDF